MDKQDLIEIQSIQKELENEKSSYVTQWKDIMKYMGTAYGQNIPESNKRTGITPPAPNYLLTDTTASTASDTLANGVEGYACGTSLQWFDYGVESVNENATDEVVKSLLEKVKKVAYLWLQKSNFYPTFRQVVRSGCDLGTGGFYFTMDRKRGLPKFKAFNLNDIETITNEFGEVETLFRKIYLTKREAIRYFGEEKINKIKTIKQCKDPRERFVFHQMISPVVNWDFTVPGDGDWLSIYWSEDYSKDTIKEERLRYKPYAIFRWEEPIFGGNWGVDSPGQLSLPAMRFVNLLVEDMIMLSELVAKGHWKKTKGLKVNFRAGGVTELESGQDYAWQQATGDLSWLAEHISYYRAVINDIYKVNLFLTLTMNLDRTKTATEVAGLSQEREVLMQSFWSRLANQIFEPLHEWLFIQILLSGNLHDITNEELDAIKEIDLKIDYISPAYMAQKRAFELGPTLQWVSDMLQLSQVNPNILDKVNFDALANIDHNSRNAKIEALISDEDANKARQIRAQLQSQANDRALNEQTLGNLASAYDKLTKAPEAGSIAESMTKSEEGKSSGNGQSA